MGEPAKTPRSECPVCPQCGGDTLPYAIQVGVQTRILTCRCLTCGHTWEIDTLDPRWAGWISGN